MHGHLETPARKNPGEEELSVKQYRDRRGFLFVFEGIDGAGKTTVSNHVARRLKGEGWNVIQLHEPTHDSPAGREIRERAPRGELTPSEELELFLRDREWHVENKISPALTEGKIILLDRYFFASGAYQSTSTGIHWKEILRRNREEIHAPEPDIVFLLDITAEEGICRVNERQCEKIRQFETLERLTRVRSVYLKMVQEEAGNFIQIDASQPIETVVEMVYQEIKRYIKENSEQLI